MSAPSAVQTPSRPKMDTKTMVSIAMLTGIAYIVMLLSKLMPSVMFLDFDFKDVVVCIGGFTFGPFAAAIISILVAFIEMLTIMSWPPAPSPAPPASSTRRSIPRRARSWAWPAAWRAWSR